MTVGWRSLKWLGGDGPQADKFMSKQVMLELPESAFSTLRETPEGFVREMRLAAAVKWYELQRVSQSKAAELAGLSRGEFLEALRGEKTVRKGKTFIGVVGMRMAPHTRAATTLEQFIAGLDLPVLAYLRETQIYVNAAFEGKTLFDLPHHLAERELEQWAYLLNWLELAKDG